MQHPRDQRHHALEPDVVGALVGEGLYGPPVSFRPREHHEGAPLPRSDNLPLFVRDAVQLVNQFVDFGVGRGDFALQPALLRLGRNVFEDRVRHR